MNQALSADTTLSHYRIVSRIGAGRMGEVYLAHDRGGPKGHKEELITI